MQDGAGEPSIPVGEVAIALLGGFVATVGGEAVDASRWRLRKGRDLVKLLALSPRHRLHREQLIDALWPAADPRAAANNLNQVVHAARRALGAGAVELSEELLTLHASVDSDEFRRAADQARRVGSPAAYRAALSLYRGELLPENRYDDWAVAPRDELAELRCELEQELAGLGSDGRLHALPSSTSSFVGREHELRELGALLAGTRLLTLAGAGGSGKTRLAYELARAVEGSYDDGVALVELAPVGDGLVVPSAVAAALDVGTLPGRSQLDSVADFLARRTTLLILDNCEHLLRASAELADALLRAAPGLTIVATSREPLRASGEVVFRVPSMAIPDPDKRLAPQELLRFEAVRLLSERATAAGPGFRVDEENAADVARICFRLDGLPLALELAAARLGALGTATLAERLDDRFRLLRGGSGAAPTRQQTLAATLQWSHDLLDDAEKVLLRRLAVFAGGFSLPACEKVCAGEGLASAAVVEVLARLVEKSLVNAEQDGRDFRYQLLETVRLYAAEQLEHSGEGERIAERHARWAVSIAERESRLPELDRDAANLRVAHGVLLERDAREALRYCVLLLPFWMRRIDLQEAHRRFMEALAADPERDALRASGLLAASAIDYRAGDLRCAEDHAQESLEIVMELGDRRAQWRALQRLGEIGIGYDHVSHATELLESARDLARREQLVPCEAVSVYSLGVARWLSGDLEGAESLLQRSAVTFGSVNAPAERIQSLLNIAEMRPAGGFARPGLRIVFEETLQPFLEISCDAAVGYVLANEATIARLRQEPDRARTLLRDAGERLSRTGEERGRADVLVRRAYLELGKERPDVARECLEQALRLRRDMRDRRGVGMTLSALGLVETTTGSYRQAEQRLREARDLFRRAGDRWGLVSSLWRTADLAMARERLDEAEEALEEARSVVRATEREGWIAVTVAMLAEVARARDEPDREAALLAEARDHYGSIGDELAAGAGSSRPQAPAKRVQRARKPGGGTTAPATTRKRRQT